MYFYFLKATVDQFTHVVPIFKVIEKVATYLLTLLK